MVPDSVIASDSGLDVDRGSYFVRGILRNAHGTCSVEIDDFQRGMMY